MNRVAHQVVFAELQRVDRARAPPESGADNKRDFVDRRDEQSDATITVRVREYARIRDEWLRSQYALCLGPSQLSAAIAQLQRQVAPDHGLACRHMLLRRKPARPLQDIVASDSERRVRIDIDPTDAFPLAGDG